MSGGRWRVCLRALCLEYLMCFGLFTLEHGVRVESFLALRRRHLMMVGSDNCL
jgi:hypothetical protein